MPEFVATHYEFATVPVLPRLACAVAVEPLAAVIPGLKLLGEIGQRIIVQWFGNLRSRLVKPMS